MKSGVDPKLSAAATISAARRALVAKASERWQTRRVDHSRNNRLLYFRPTKGSLELEAPREEPIQALLAGQKVSLPALVDAKAIPSAGQSLKIARKKAVENFEERGLSTLFLAFGSATWTPSDGGRPAAAPVLLLPVELERRGRESRDIAIESTGELELNLSLTYYLRREHGIDLKEEELLDGYPEDGDADVLGWVRAAFGAVLQRASTVPGFRIETRYVLGNFSFQKLSMLRDVKDAELLARHDLIAAIAGDAESRDKFRESRDDKVQPAALDRIPPTDEHLILDADSTQHAAIVAAGLGRSGVIQGPPGCGKSQTIANMIAGLVAEGKRVLFVAEKRAALDVVLERLRRSGLESLVLDLHGGELKKKAVASRLAAALDRFRSPPPVDDASIQDRFAADRATLIQYVEKLHAPTRISGLSTFEMQGELLSLRRAGVSGTTRWRGRALEALAGASADELIAQAARNSQLFLGIAPTAWVRSKVSTQAELGIAFDALEKALRAAHALRRCAGNYGKETGFEALASVGALEEASALVSRAKALLERFRAEIFGANTPRLAAEAAPARRGILARIWHFITDAAYRGAIRTLRALTIDGTIDSTGLAEAADEAANLLRAWASRSGGRERAPSVGPTHGEIEAGLRILVEARGVGSRLLPTDVIFAEDVEDLEDGLTILENERDSANLLPTIAALRRRFQELDLQKWVEEVTEKQVDPVGFPAHYRSAFLSSCLNDVMEREPCLGAFDGREHEAIVREFQALDKKRRELAARRVLRQQMEFAVRARSEYRSEDDLVKREANKTYRHLGFRKLVTDAPHVVSALFPCWMASPLSISHLVPADFKLFDTVIFDEASQVFPEDAVPALLRGHRAIVAGDRHQLPPTAFFADTDSDEDVAGDEGEVAGFESILDQMASFLDVWSLDWHYRSRDERLIAFSNREVYGGRLITFPGTAGASSVRLVEIPWRPGQTIAGQEHSSSPEVERVVELVREHARTRPEESLGVIAFGIPHQRRVEEALERACLHDPELAAFFERKGEEPCFVKNLERVQGDERDAILLTVGYGRDATGTVPLRFGPINSSQGYRRLNVAISRARRRMTVVSSFTHRDLDPSRVKERRGLEMLRNYLEFASHGGDRLPDRGGGQLPENAFEADVRAELERRGLQVEPQWGASTYVIDLVARHPTQPGRFVLAIECDGATYHSAPTARDRDRLRQNHLEALGWAFCRIWSTDWFRYRDREAERVVEAFARAVEAADLENRAPPEARKYPVELSLDAIGHNVVRDRLAPNEAQQVRAALNIRVGRESIDQYLPRELVSIVEHVCSDGVLRTNDELVEEVTRVLGFKRKGAKIVREIEAAILRAPGQRKSSG